MISNVYGMRGMRVIHLAVRLLASSGKPFIFSTSYSYLFLPAFTLPPFTTW